MKTIYTKFSNERSAEFAICTNILLGNDGKKYIEKQPMHDAGTEHIKRLNRWEKELNCKYKDTVYEANRLLQMEGHLCFEYVQGETLESMLDALFYGGEKDALCEMLENFAKDILAVNNECDFDITDEFRKVFGDVTLPSGLRCARVTNIDMIPANIIVHDGKRTIIDYEWTFDFPIPAHYVIYRMLRDYITGSSELRAELQNENLYEKMGLTQEEIRAYEEMEICFQKYILGQMVPIWKIHASVVKPKYAVEEMFNQVSMDEFKVELFWDTGKGFRAEENQIFSNVLEDNGDVNLRISVANDVKAVRLDPGELPCIVVWDYAKGYIETEEGDKEYLIKISTNAGLNTKGIYFFGAEDPQIYLDGFREGTREISISFGLYRDMCKAHRYKANKQIFAPGSSKQDYDELEQHYWAAIGLKQELEKRVEDLEAELEKAQRTPFRLFVNFLKKCYRKLKRV